METSSDYLFELTEKIDRAVAIIEGGLLGTESRRGIWTDRDYLVHALAILTTSDRAREAALAKPKAINAGNLRPKDVEEGKGWWAQYEKMADDLDEFDTQHQLDTRKVDSTVVRLAADDIRTLVSGLRDMERRLPADDARAAETKDIPDPAER